MVAAMNDAAQASPPSKPEAPSAFAVGLHGLLDDGPFPDRRTMAYRALVSACAAIGTLIPVTATLPDFAPAHGAAAMVLEAVAVTGLLLDLVLHGIDAWLVESVTARRPRALMRYLVSPWGVIDLLAALPFLIRLAAPLSDDLYTVFAIARFLKLARFSPALETLQAVLSREVKPLRAAIFILLLAMLCSATLLYFVERGSNPDFGSVPQALWWAAVTLTTLGYGDVYPHSPLGKLLGAMVAVLGVGMFALPASILATGFSEEVKRRDFLHTWHMVAKVPFFAELDADQIAAIIGLLRPMQAMPGGVLMRMGEVGDRMFFVINGEVEVALAGNRQAILKDGSFFGEIALLNSARRTATVTARSRCQLLALDARDFRHFLAGSPQIATSIAHTARERLREQTVFAEDSAPPAEV